MALTTNKIGIHQFICLQGQQQPPAQVKVIDERQGVNGSEFVLTGKKGRPFSLISMVDCDSYEDALNTHIVYQRLIEEDAQEIVQADVSGDSLGYRVVVLNVELLEARRIAGAAGNLFSDQAGGFLVCRWDLCAVPLES